MKSRLHHSSRSLASTETMARTVASPSGMSVLMSEPGLQPMRPIMLQQPGRIFFGNGCASEFKEHLAGLNLPGIVLFSSPSVKGLCAGLFTDIGQTGFEVAIAPRIDTEPGTAHLEKGLRVARDRPGFGIVAVGGGSVMDVAKLVAALADGSQSVDEVFGINKLNGRGRFLACLPTTAGTGSEVSPNAILLDESCQLKKGVISPHLIPDVACVDPRLTLSLPPGITAATGLDALTHCVEAHANKFAHPVIDLFALEGIRLIAGNLLDAVQDGKNPEARANVALGSMYGGLCLGPVNTAAVHALAYPLGSQFHVAHGISNAVLLPHVLRFNLSAAEHRYAKIATALGVEPADSGFETAERGIDRITELLTQCPVPRSIAELGVPKGELRGMAKAALTITRLLKNNPRVLTEEDALQIYLSAYQP